MLKFLLGLPHVMRGPLIDAARSLNAPVLFSANALSIWKKDPSDVPVWHGFNTRNLHYLDGLEAYLDSAGFVAASRYQGFAWTVDNYLDLGAARPLGAGSPLWTSASNQKSPETEIWFWAGSPVPLTSTGPVFALPRSEASSTA